MFKSFQQFIALTLGATTLSAAVAYYVAYVQGKFNKPEVQLGFTIAIPVITLVGLTLAYGINQLRGKNRKP